jgi:hypothetical protein
MCINKSGILDYVGSKMRATSQRAAILITVFVFYAFSSPRAGVAPDGYNTDRYASLWQHSPFALATVEQQAPPGFAQNFAVVAVARVDDEDLVTILNRVSQERFTVSADPNADGIKLVSVDSDPDPLKTKVKLQKGTENATIGFDKALLAMNQAPAPPPPNAAAPGVPGVPATAALAAAIRQRANLAQGAAVPSSPATVPPPALAASAPASASPTAAPSGDAPPPPLIMRVRRTPPPVPGASPAQAPLTESQSTPAASPEPH